MECDLQPWSRQNIADDTNVFVPKHTDCQLDEEFSHTENWALKNKMIIIKAKTKELVFISPHPTKFDMADPRDGIAQEHAAKLLVFVALILSQITYAQAF